MISGPPRRLLQSLNMSLDVVDEIAKSGRPMGVSEIAAVLGLSKGAVHTVLTNLESRGYVSRPPGTLAFSLGHRLWELGLKASQRFDMAELVNAELAEITKLTGETSQLMTYVPPGEVLFLHRVQSSHPVQIMIPIGERAPASTTSGGQVLLAHQPEEEIERALAQPLPAMTPNSITNPDALRRVLQEVRHDGYVINSGIHYPDMVTMAAAVRDYTGRVAYALSVYGPEYRFNLDAARKFLPQIIEAAGAISHKLGYRPFAAETPPATRRSPRR